MRTMTISCITCIISNTQLPNRPLRNNSKHKTYTELPIDKIFGDKVHLRRRRHVYFHFTTATSSLQVIPSPFGTALSYVQSSKNNWLSLNHKHVIQID